MHAKKLGDMSQMIGFLTLIYLTIATSACFGLQNIRIQVNNENLQSPPYLLEALKQAAAVDDGAAQAPAQPAITSANGELPGPDGPSRLQVANENLGRREGSNSAANSNENLGAIKEETIEELLDLQPESVLRLSPEGLINSVSSQEAGSSAPAAVAPPASDATLSSSVAAERSDQDVQASNVHEVRKAQLPVTSSHLKRPALSAQQLDEPSQQPALSVQQSGSPVNQAASTASGAKSRISPSVSSDEEDRPAVNLENKRASGGPHPPDTWEASQVMQGVTNVSLVPATVRRQYGHQTRTRITLGGGYTRNKMPPLVDPSSSDYHDDKPEKPLTPLERPTSSVSLQLAESSNVDDYEQSGGGSSSLIENSRLIEVPKRIVMPVGVFNQDEAGAPSVSVTKRPSANATVTRRRDSRCPANGVTSLEHPTACDKYFLCQDGAISEQTCPNGLLYGTRDVVRDFCVHRWEAVCGDKSVPNPISSPGCRWQYGIFQVQGSPKCVPDFYECKEGQFEVRKCSIGGQVYDDKTKSCRYAEQVGCTQEALADFRCPADDQTNTYWPFPRYFLNERALIHCVNDKPEIIRCRDHERVDPEHLFCVPINKSDTSTGDEPATPEITARRSSNNNQQREKAAPTATTTDTKPVGAPAASAVTE